MSRVDRLLVTTICIALGLTAGSAPAVAQGTHLNPVVDLLAKKQPVFGLYAPSNRRGRGAPPADAPPPKTPAQLAFDALGNQKADYIFDGTMEGDFDRAFPTFAEFMQGMKAGGTLQGGSVKHLHQPVFVKTHEIAPDPALAAQRIGRQLNTGVTGIVFVGVESAEEVRTGLAAMRFRSQGAPARMRSATRPRSGA